MADRTEGLLTPLLRKWRFHIARPLIQGRVLDYGLRDEGEMRLGRLPHNLSLST